MNIDTNKDVDHLELESPSSPILNYSYKRKLKRNDSNFKSRTRLSDKFDLCDTNSSSLNLNQIDSEEMVLSTLNKEKNNLSPTLGYNTESSKLIIKDGSTPKLRIQKRLNEFIENKHPSKKIRLADEASNKTKNIPLAEFTGIILELIKSYRFTTDSLELTSNHEYFKNIEYLYRFQTGSGNPISISSSSLNIANNFLTDTIVESEKISSNNNTNADYDSSFLTINNCDEANKINEELKEHNFFNDIQVGKFTGFVSGTGNQIQFSTASKKEVLSIFNTIKDKNEKKLSNPSTVPKLLNLSKSVNRNNILKDQRCDKNIFPKQVEFQKSIFIDQLRKGKLTRVFNGIEEQEKNEDTNLVKSSNEQTTKNIFKSERDNISLKLEDIKTCDSDKKLVKNIIKRTLGVKISKSTIPIENVDKVKYLFQNVSAPMQKTELTCSTPTKAQNSSSFDSTLTPIRKCEKSLILDTKLFAFVNRNNDTLEGLNRQIEYEIKVVEIRFKVLQQRKLALRDQLEQIKESFLDENTKPGILFTAKQGKNRLNLKNGLVLNDSLKDTFWISPSQAQILNFKCARDIPLIKTKDGACIVPNVNDCVGLPEIVNAFFTTPGVNIKLLSKDWIQNHYKWIVWKLASYTNFTLNGKECLNVENLMQQLKYRYDCEIVSKHQSTIYKIYTRADSPSKRMTLCVSNVIPVSHNKFQIELTDNWYSIIAEIDDYLNSVVAKGKIFVGMKLIICNAKLLGDLIDTPLKASTDVRIQISANSTRRAKWDSKLGYHKCWHPFVIQMNSVVFGGGVVSCLKVYVARIYPEKYLEKQGNLSVWRNNKAEEVYADNWTHEKMKKFREIQNVITAEHKNAQVNSKHVNKEEIENETCPQKLYTHWESSYDQDSFFELLNDTQKKELNDYHINRSLVKQEELETLIKNKVEKEIVNRNVSSVLQILVVDFLNENQSNIFQVWNSSLSFALEEDSVYFFSNILARSNGVFCATSRTQYEKIQNVSTNRFDIYKRKLSTISNMFREQSLNFNEFDTVGIIIEMSVTNSGQILWLADADENLLYIKCFQGPNSCLLINNLKELQVIVAKNLRFISNKVGFVDSVANHVSIITRFPREKCLQEGLDYLSVNIPKDLTKFLSNCKEKINILISPMKSMNKSVAMDTFFTDKEGDADMASFNLSQFS